MPVFDGWWRCTAVSRGRADAGGGRARVVQPWHDAAWRPWYTAVWAETGVLAGLADRRTVSTGRGSSSR